MKPYLPRCIGLLLTLANNAFSEPNLAVNQVGLEISFSDKTVSISGDGCEQFYVGENLFCGRRVLVSLSAAESVRNLQFSSATSTLVGYLDPETLVDQPTSLDPGRIEEILNDLKSEPLGQQAVLILGERQIGQARYAEMFLLPHVSDQAGAVYRVDSISMQIGGRQIETKDLLDAQSPELQSAVSTSPQSSPLFEAGSYLIVTADRLVGAVSELAVYRRSVGFDVSIATIETITATHDGIDDSEKLREYLKEFYAAGGRYVLLAGDETVLPVRYTYPYNRDYQPSLELQFPSDLYFADLTGDWDLDNDSVYGEITHDASDLVPELLL
ncbi:MAG: C25 family cysteine peptidase, partial [candidate division Zixibacteria bacterium]